MSSPDHKVDTDGEEDRHILPVLKFEYPSDDEASSKYDDESKVNFADDDKDADAKELAPSSFRLRLAEAQLTDSLSVADHDNVDMIAEKVGSSSRLIEIYMCTNTYFVGILYLMGHHEQTTKDNNTFLAEMDDVINNLHSWKSTHDAEMKQDEKDLEYEDDEEENGKQFKHVEDGPETDAHERILSQLTPREDLEIKGYHYTPEMLDKVAYFESLLNKILFFTN